MGIPAPRIDYNSLATPGGIGQGLAALGDSVIRARIARNKADQDAQGLARMESRDAKLAAQNEARLAEEGRHNRAIESTKQQELDLRGLESFGAGVKNFAGGLSKFADPTAAARVRHLDSMTAKNMRPPAPPKIPEVGEAAYSVARRALADQEEGLRNESRTNPDFQGAPAGIFSAAVPAKRNLQTELQQLRETSDDAKIVREYMRQMEEHAKARASGSAVPPGGPSGPGGSQAPIPATAIPASVGALRKRVTQLYGGTIPPEVEQSLMEAEEGDADSAQQLEELFTPADENTIAPTPKTNLLGEPE